MSKTQIKEIAINGVTYVEKGAEQNKAKTLEDYCIVRCDRSGVFAGTLFSRDEKEGTMENVRCLWYWDGAASLMQLAVDGVSKPGNCKFTKRVASLELTDIIQVIPCTEKAMKSIEGVEEWVK